MLNFIELTERRLTAINTSEQKKEPANSIGEDDIPPIRIDDDLLASQGNKRENHSWGGKENNELIPQINKKNEH